jgi:hypothetical protein
MRRIKKHGPEINDVATHSILIKIMTREVPELEGLISGDGREREYCYDRLLAIVVWDLTDNPSSAHILGIESLDDLVALLENASLAEAKFSKVST